MKLDTPMQPLFVGSCVSEHCCAKELHVCADEHAAVLQAVSAKLSYRSELTVLLLFKNYVQTTPLQSQKTVVITFPAEGKWWWSLSFFWDRWVLLPILHRLTFVFWIMICTYESPPVAIWRIKGITFLHQEFSHSTFLQQFLHGCRHFIVSCVRVSRFRQMPLHVLIVI